VAPLIIKNYLESTAKVRVVVLAEKPNKATGKLINAFKSVQTIFLVQEFIKRRANVRIYAVLW